MLLKLADTVLILINACVHVKLEIHLFVMNFNSTGFLYCVVDTGYGLGGSLEDCRPALLKGRKDQMVKTQTETHVRRPVV